MEEDVMSPSEKAEYEGYVLEYLAEAGINEPSSSSQLLDLDRDKLKNAIKMLKSDFDASLNLSVSTLAFELWKATKSR
ncbi:hypothetical protein ACIP1G_12915 [Pseudomonas sp. NPDC089392]|uniref:hypothetical protein n=1 Tax=Pseudomonas sp. NPDC089392 TaxID=3364459 RepID=UPI0037F7FDA2